MGSEFDRIARLDALFGRRHGDVLVGIGDDAAVVEAGGTRWVISVDTSIEDTHWRRAWLSERDVGYRAQVAAMSDLAAMGAAPRHAVVALALPGDLAEASFDALAMGIREASDAIGYAVIGGNLARSREISITTTVFGALAPSEAPLLRAGAREGDVVAVTGVVGAAALGLRALESGNESDALEPFRARWRRPIPRFQEAKDVRAVAHACIDLSDGLVQDAGHLAAASGLGLTLHAAAVPRLAGWEEAARLLDRDPLTFGLDGGEDYELLFTAPPSATLPEGATAIGQVTGGPAEVTVLGRDGAPLRGFGTGFDHFR